MADQLQTDSVAEAAAAPSVTVSEEQLAQLRSPALRELAARGLLFQCTDVAALDERLATEPIVAYCGYDLTAPSLHVGNLVTLMILRTLQRHGHGVIALLGGGTTKVGDPSGKDDMRQLLDGDTIAHNRDRIGDVIKRFLEFGPTAGKVQPATMVDNAEWLDELAYIEFLREVGRHFTINRMLTMESVQRRLDRSQPLTFLEFNYMILQAYDFVELHKRYGCALQVGGSDQWGNIINGVELGRRMADTRIAGLTAPLLLNAAGDKMGKTVGGAVWLSADLMAPYDFWQYWRNADDADVEKLLRLFTDLPEAELDRLAALEGQAINDAKITLATELTALVHGRAEAEKAEATARETFKGDGVAEGLPSFEVTREDLEAGMAFFAILGASGLVESNSAARRLIKQGGGRINDAQERDANRLVSIADLDEQGLIKLSAGKKKHVLVRVAEAG